MRSAVSVLVGRFMRAKTTDDELEAAGEIGSFVRARRRIRPEKRTVIPRRLSDLIESYRDKSARLGPDHRIARQLKARIGCFQVNPKTDGAVDVSACDEAIRGALGLPGPQRDCAPKPVDPWELLAEVISGQNPTPAEALWIDSAMYRKIDAALKSHESEGKG